MKFRVNHAEMNECVAHKGRFHAAKESARKQFQQQKQKKKRRSGCADPQPEWNRALIPRASKRAAQKKGCNGKKSVFARDIRARTIFFLFVDGNVVQHSLAIMHSHERLAGDSKNAREATCSDARVLYMAREMHYGSCLRLILWFDNITLFGKNDIDLSG